MEAVVMANPTENLYLSESQEKTSATPYACFDPISVKIMEDDGCTRKSRFAGILTKNT